MIRTPNKHFAKAPSTSAANTAQPKSDAKPDAASKDGVHIESRLSKIDKCAQVVPGDSLESERKIK